MNLEQLLEQLSNTPEAVEFSDVIDVIEQNYEFTPTAFKNGELENKAGENNGSCQLFSFGQIQKLDADKMLACFGSYYRVDVLQNPQGNDHQNIRNFMISGWGGIQYAGQALKIKAI